MKPHCLLIAYALGVLFVSQANGEPLTERIERMLNPASRFRIYEPTGEGTFRERTLTGFCTAQRDAWSFAIRGLADDYLLVIDIGQDGHTAARLVSPKDVEQVSDKHQISVSQNSGKFGLSDQSLDKRLSARNGMPLSIVFGVYWDLLSPQMGLNVVEYTIAYRLKPDGPIQVVHCSHSLLGTPLQAPREAVANTAAGAFVAKCDSLFGLISQLDMLKDMPPSKERDRLRQSVQLSADNLVVGLAKLRELALQAHPTVREHVNEYLKDRLLHLKILRAIRDDNLALEYLSADTNAEVGKLLKCWEDESALLLPTRIVDAVRRSK